ncbi:hypothetical protein ACNKHU_26610 [Shigella flexneri]
MYSLGPLSRRSSGNGTVHGEVYRIDNATLAELMPRAPGVVKTRAS